MAVWSSMVAPIHWLNAGKYLHAVIEVVEEFQAEKPGFLKKPGF
jgi:hypothetical protein